MKNANQPRKRRAPNGDPSATKAQSSVPERQEAEQSEHFETAGSKDGPVDRADLADKLDGCRTQLHDYEQVLVERIADVDDDLRATASRLQRTQQSQHDAIDKRLQRHAWFLGGLMLFAVLFAVALFLLYRQSVLESSRVATEVSEIHQGRTGLSAEQSVQAQVRERPEQETTRVAGVATAAKEPDPGEAPAAPTSSAPEQTSGEGAGGRLSESPDTERKGRAQDPEIPHAQAAPPKLAASTAAEDAPDGTESAGSVPEQRAGGPPEAETARADNPEAVGDDVPATAGADAGASDREHTQVGAENSYGLQLIGFFNRKTLDQFAARKGLPARVYVIRGTNKRRPWYTIIHSLHSDYAVAKEELSRLPADLAALKPWIRSLREGTRLEVVETGLEPSRVATEGSEIHPGPANLPAAQEAQAQVRESPDQVTTPVAEATATSEEPDPGEAPAAPASSATGQPPGEQAADHRSAKTQHPDTEQQRDRAQDPAARHSTPTSTGSGSAPPKIAAPVSATEVSDGTQNAGSAPEAGKADSPPVVATARVDSPGARASDVPVAAGADADAAGHEQTQVVAENDYGLQLIGFFNRKTVDKFVARKGLPARVYIIRGTHKRKKRYWYAIIHSLHPDRAAAKEELSRLPPELAALGPLVRPLRKGTKLQVIETGAE